MLKTDDDDDDGFSLTQPKCALKTNDDDDGFSLTQPKCALKTNDDSGFSLTQAEYAFLVPNTQLRTLLCRSVYRSIGRSVPSSVTNSKHSLFLFLM